MSTFKAAGYFSGKKSGSKSSFAGTIYYIKDAALKPTLFGRNQHLPTDLTKLASEIKTKLCDIEGNWLTHINVNKKQIWTIESHKVTRPINQTVSNSGKDVLPSDWRFREDLIWLQYGFQAIG